MQTVLKKALDERGISTNALHKKVGGNRTAIYLVVKRHGRASKPLQGRIAEALELPVSELFDGFGWALLAREEG